MISIHFLAQGLFKTKFLRVILNYQFTLMVMSVIFTSLNVLFSYVETSNPHLDLISQQKYLFLVSIISISLQTDVRLCPEKVYNLEEWQQRRRKDEDSQITFIIYLVDSIFMECYFLNSRWGLNSRLY